MRFRSRAKAFASLDEAKAGALETDILELIHQFNRGPDGTVVVSSEYLDVVIHKA